MATETKTNRNHPPKKSRIELAHEFSELPVDALATSAQYAAFLNVSEAKLERDRWAGGGVPFYKHGRNVRYLKRTVLAHIQTQASTSRVAPKNEQAPKRVAPQRGPDQSPTYTRG